MAVQGGVGVVGIEFPIEDAVGPVVGRAEGEVLFDFGRAPVAREVVVIVLRIHRGAEIELPIVVEAEDLMRLGFAAGEGGHEERGENRDDGDDNEEFDEGERSRASYPGTTASS